MTTDRHRGGDRSGTLRDLARWCVHWEDRCLAAPTSVSATKSCSLLRYCIFALVRERRMYRALILARRALTAAGDMNEALAAIGEAFAHERQLVPEVEQLLAQARTKRDRQTRERAAPPTDEPIDFGGDST